MRSSIFRFVYASMRPPLFSGGNSYLGKYTVFKELRPVIRPAPFNSAASCPPKGLQVSELGNFLSIFRRERVSVATLCHAARIAAYRESASSPSHRVSNPGYVRVSPVM